MFALTRMEIGAISQVAKVGKDVMFERWPVDRCIA